MKRILVFGVLFGCLNTSANGQVNLVPNPGFDTIISCPNNGAQLYKAFPWIDPTNASTDLINICGSGNYCEAPSNEYGWQYPFTGNGFAGIGSYADTICCADTREYVQAQLTSSLQAGKKYCVSFRISWADSSQYAIDGIGAYFSVSAISCSACRFQYIPQVQNPSGHLLNDGNQWELIKGSFTAQGGEEFITLGNFKSDANSNVQLINPNGFYIVAYYFLDDISVAELAECNAGISNQICPGDSTQLGITLVNGVTYSWQPSIGLSNANTSNPKASPSTTTTYTLTQIQCEDTTTATVTVTVRNDCDILPPLIIPTILKSEEKLSISGLQTGSKLEIVDMRGRMVFVSENYQNEFGGNDVAVGMYALRFTQPGGEVIKQKLCIVK